jgi:hypothetical protein
MRPIRPLFHSPWSKTVPGPQCYDAFAQWVGDTLRGKVSRNFDRHPRPPHMEKVKNPDGKGYQYIARWPEGISSVHGIIKRARESRRELLRGQVKFLRNHLARTLSADAFRDWLSDAQMGKFFFEDDWNREQNHRKFALYGLACFVNFFRPGEIDWRTPNHNDLQLVAKLLDIFGGTNDIDKQGKLVRRLFDLKENFKEIAVEATTGPSRSTKGLSRADRVLLLECRRLRLKGEARARWLQKHRFKGFGKSPLTKYRENPHSMRAQISAWTSVILED